VTANTTLRFWISLCGAGALLFALMRVLASALGSVRGEAGLAVGAVMLAATLGADRLLFAGSFLSSWRALGLNAPSESGLLAAGLVSALLLAALPVAATLTGAHLSLRADWLWLAPGLLAQAELAEEVLFRGFVYGRIRDGRPFWRAVALSLPPFVLVHVLLLASLAPALALASLALSVAITPALCHLYELGGRTIWGPALVHAAVQGAIKIVDIEGGDATQLALIWIAACAAAPNVAFLWRRSEPQRRA
jgi:membrane protease YdiL (CAAX protease family)